MTRPCALFLSFALLGACSARVVSRGGDASAPEKTPSLVASESLTSRPARSPAVPGASPAPAAPPLAKAVLGIGAELPQFTAELVDLSGTKPVKKKFDSHRATGTWVYVFLGTTCPASRAYVERFRDLERTYQPKGVSFVYVYPDRTDTSEAKVQFHRQGGFTGPMIDDQGGQVARTLQARRGSETLLVGKDRKILFRGGIDDSRDAARVRRRHLALALNDYLANRPITTTQTPVFS
jgi:thiol-disulfide isomerase/thioredoxin